MLKLLILAAACAGVSHSLCLPCGGSPCQTPVCCKSGEYVKSGYCGCCLQCAKAEGEECGGDWEEKGRCAAGMACTRSVLDKSWAQKCRKPKKASGDLGNLQPGPLDINQQPSKPEIIAAPICPSGKTANDMTCHCSKEPAVKGLDGNTRGGCVPSLYHRDEKAQGWCFLENIQNPGNGTQNCFEDTQWSVVDGRFWSNLACIGDYKRKEEELLGIGLQPANIPYPGLLVEKEKLEEKLDIGPGLLDIQPPGQEGSPHITAHPHSQIVPKNEPFTFNCMADGYPEIKYTWYKDGEIVSTAPSSPKSHRVILPGGSLFFLNVRQNKKVQDSGIYWCEAANSVGKARSRNATLEVADLNGPIQTTTEHLEMYTNPPGCPEEQPLFCLPEEEGKTCSYGSQKCCGEVTPMVTVECKKGSWWPSLQAPDIRCRFGYDEC